jgi:HK97 family phage portal protein
MEISLHIGRNKRSGNSPDSYPEYFPQGNLQQFYNWLVSGMFGKKTAAGEPVDKDTALKFSAVFACVRILSETLACLPFGVYKKDKDGNKTQLLDHPIAHLIENEPNPIMTSFIFRETMMAHLCLWGNAYAKIIRDNKYNVIELRLLDPEQVNPKLYGGRIKYHLKGENAVWDMDDILHIPALGFDGIKGKTPIEVHAESIGLGLALQRYGAEFFANGTTLSGVFEHPAKLSQPAYDRLKSSLKEQHEGQGNRHKTQILEEGMKWTQMSIAPEAAQYILSRKFSINEINRVFRIPPHMTMDLDRATFSNIEHQGIEFVTNTMLPWCKRIEQEFNRKLLREDEKATTFTKLNLMGLMRGDALARANYFQKRFAMGSMSANEIRRMEDENSIGPEGDKYYVMTNLGDTGDVNTSKEPIVTNIGE